MQRRLLAAAVCVLAGMLTAQLVPPLWAQARGRVTYSRAPGDVVITFDQTGSKEKRRVDEPFMQIYGDGRIVARNVFKLRAEKEARLTTEQFDALIKELLVDYRLVRHDPEKYRAKLAKENFKAADFAEEPTTVITIVLQDRTITASQIGLDLAASRHLTVDELQKMHDAGKRLKTLWTQVMTGEFVSEVPATGPATSTAPVATQPATAPATEPATAPAT